MSYIKNRDISLTSALNYDSLSTPYDIAMSIQDVLNEPSLFYELELGEVIDIIETTNHKSYNSELNNIGFVQVKLIHNPDKLIWCKPSHIGFITYPLIGEVVLVGEYEQSSNLLVTNYWLNTFKIGHNLNNNFFNFESGKNNKLLTIENSKEKEYQQDFKNGDSVLNGRLGQHLIFTFNENDKPEISLSIDNNKLIQTTEISNYELFSNLSNNNYSAKEISNSGVTVIESDNVVLQSSESLYLSSDNNINVSSNNMLNIQSKNNVTVDGKKILLGNHTKNKAVLGDELKKILNELITEIINIKVVAAGSISSTPLNSVKIKSIIMKLDKILSRKIEIE